jgi:hypothetical protein
MELVVGYSVGLTDVIGSFWLDSAMAEPIDNNCEYFEESSGSVKARYFFTR